MNDNLKQCFIKLMFFTLVYISFNNNFNLGILLLIIYLIKQIEFKELFKNNKLNPLKRKLWYTFHDDIFLNDYYNVKYDLINPSKLHDPSYIKLSGHL